MRLCLLCIVCSEQFKPLGVAASPELEITILVGIHDFIYLYLCQKWHIVIYGAVV